MDVLIRYGFSIEEIKNMMDTNFYIESLSDKNIEEIIKILEKNGCGSDHIKNIFVCNPFVLNKKASDIKELSSTLLSLGFNELYILFDSNPYILNLNSIDITKIYDDLNKKGLNKFEIVDYFNRNMVI